MPSEYLGYSLIAIGIIMLLFTFLLGYGIYQNINNGSLQIQHSNVAGSNVTALVGSTLQSLTSGANSSLSTIIEIIVLFLFANIGYKMATLGMKMFEMEPKPNQASNKK
jgi:uncharacterized BrkB/YihY/UPF0761 family membrane protein